MKPLLIRRDGNNTNTFGRPAPDYVKNLVLEAATNKAVTIPAGAKFAVFSSDGNFYARPDAAAAVPGADVTDGTGSEINPTIWEVENLTSINLAGSAGRVVSIAFYKASN
jgi:hypothetical protein